MDICESHTELVYFVFCSMQIEWRACCAPSAEGPPPWGPTSTKGASHINPTPTSSPTKTGGNRAELPPIPRRGGGSGSNCRSEGDSGWPRTFSVAHREPCVIRQRSWIFARRVVHCFSGSVYGVVVVGRSPTFESLQPELDRRGSK